MLYPSHHAASIPSSRIQRDGGYLLLAILLMMALMIIAATIVAPKMVQQIKRDREAEMIHRGTEYARAIKKFYKKNGRYPSTLDDLDKGQVKFLRQRYKDPLTKDGKWKLLNYGDIQTLLNGAAPGVPAASLSSQGGGLTPGGAVLPGGQSSPASSFGFGSNPQQQATQPSQFQQQQVPGANNGFSVPSSQGYQDPNIVNLTPQSGVGSGQGFSADSSTTTNGQQSSGGSPFGSSGSSTDPNQQSNSPFSQNPAGGTQTFGGGAVVGVASLSKDPTIRIYNKKKTYNEWQFIYNPMMDIPNVLLRGPYQPTTIGGSQIGTPASQMNGQQGSSGQNSFGQQNNGFGQQNNSFGQQNNSFGQQPSTSPQTVPQQPMQPSGSSYPPEQNQPQ
jgi:type II secretory pathway pseudopilin PulG